MAAQFFLGTFVNRATTGSQSVTGVGFLPKALIIWSGLLATTPEANNFAGQTFSWTDGITFLTTSSSSDDNVATSEVNRDGTTSKLIHHEHANGVLQAEATLTSFDSDGWTMNWTAVNIGQERYHFIALGGSGTSFKAGVFNAGTVTGHKATTGVGFQPAAVLMIPIWASGDTTDAMTIPAMGWTDGVQQGASWWVSLDAKNPSQTFHYQNANKCVAVGHHLTGALYCEADIVSLDPDGFTLNWTTAPTGTTPRIFYFAMAGVYASAGSFSQPVTTGTQSITALPRQPTLMFFQNAGAPTSGTVGVQARYALGASMGSGGHVAATHDTDNVSPTIPARFHSETLAIASMTAAATGTASTINASAEVTSFDPNGFTLNWLIADATEREILYLALTPKDASPISYEDPCAIAGPRVFTVIKTADETLKYGIHPLRDSAAIGGYAEPRLLDVGPCARAASDPSSGAWSAQTATTRFADTDRANRALTETRFGFRGATQEVYLTSNAQRRANLPPRVIFSGIINADTCDPFLGWTTAINDLIGNSYSLFAEEKQIPQRAIGITHFPQAPKDALGRGEPILGGRLAPANALNGQGVVDGIYVGPIAAGSSPGTPDAGTLAALVADMQAAADINELDAQFGDRLGHGDCSAAEGTTIPSTEGALKAQFGTADIDAILQEYAATGGSTKEVVLFAGHAVKGVLNGLNGDPSIWINDTQISPAEIGVSVDIETSFDIIGTDGVTRRYFLLLFEPGSDYGDLVVGGASVHLDCEGIEDIGDGTGTLLTDYFDLYRHVLINFLLQNYMTGPWLASPQFLFSDGVTYLDRVDEASFAEASVTAVSYRSGGYLGGFKIGDRTSIRTIIQNFNMSAACLLAADDYGRFIVKILNPSRTAFFDGHRTLRDKVDFLPGFVLTPHPEWQVNRLFYQYAQNYHLAQYERGEGGGGVAPVEYLAGQARDGVITKTIQLPYMRDDLTALSVAGYYRDLFANLPRVAEYTRRGLCGLEDDVLDGVPITHYNGYGSGGWTDHAVWVLSKTFHPKSLTVSFTALDVDALVS